MTISGTFAIEGSHKLTRRGLVIYGDITSGRVSKHDFLSFIDRDQEIEIEIDGINSIDNISEGIFKVGLMFNYDSDERKKQLDNLLVEKQSAKIISK
jgi:selenocysteine-specific translation elongation factor